MIYIIKNITDGSSSPKEITIADIPDVGVIKIKAGEQKDLEIWATRNQILDSSHLKLHLFEGRAMVISVSNEPDERIFVDAYISGGVVNQGTNPWIISGVVTTNTNTASFDAFSRQRVSEPFTLGDYKHTYGLDQHFIDYTVNGGTVTLINNQAAARLTTSSNSSSRVVHQSAVYHHYLPGKSQMILSSFCFYSATENVIKRTGYFDDYNGIFFEQAGNGVLAVVLRSYTSGSVIETKISQFGGVYGVSDTGWLDPCNGHGTSGYNLDINKTQLVSIDFQWLGVGRVRVGLVHAGSFIRIAEFNGTNNLSVVYMSNPNLPVRCEIANTGTTVGAYFDQICATVASEGGYMEAGQDHAILNPSARFLTVGATLPILAIRLKNTYNGLPNRMIARLNDISVFSETGNIKYQVVKLGSSLNLTGGAGVWTPVHPTSGVEYRADATGITSPDTIAIGFAAAASQGGNKAGSVATATSSSTAKKNYITQNFDSTSSQIYAIVATNIDNKDTNVTAGIQWREIF